MGSSSIISPARCAVAARQSPPVGYAVALGLALLHAVAVGPASAASTPSELVNISVRTRVGTGDAVLIAGFVVSGAGTRPLLVRALGPTLGAAPYNVPGVLADPGVQFHRENTTLQTNDNWGNDATLAATFARLGAFPLLPTGKDAALFAPLTEGVYTAIANGQAGQQARCCSKCTTRAKAPARRPLSATELPVGGTRIAGFVVSPGAPKRLLIRAIGPTLGLFGVPGTLEAPRLRLFTGSTDVVVNDDWNQAENAEAMVDTMRAVGAFALARNSRDAAALTTLQPGGYTLHVTSADPTVGGVTLVEIYDADPVLAPPPTPTTPTPGLPTVTATVVDGNAIEAADTGCVMLARTGATTAALVVRVNWSGTALAGLDYTALPTSVTIPAGGASTTITLTPLPDAIVAAPEAAIVAIVPQPNLPGLFPNLGNFATNNLGFMT